MLKNYFLITIRNLSRNKVYTFINIAGLSLGLCCAMLIMLYVKDEVSYDKFHSNVQQIHRVVTQGIDKDGNKAQRDGNSGFLQGPAFASQVPGIKAFVRIQSAYEEFKNGTEVTAQEMLRVDSSFFSVFSFPLLSGDPKTCLKEPRSVVLSEEAAKKRFGSADVVGQTILVKDNGEFVPYQVTAVAKKCPQNSSIKFEALMPLQISAEDMTNKENWFNFFLNTFVVLDPTAIKETVEKNMQKVYESDSRDGLKTIVEKYGPVELKSEYQLQPFTDMHLSKELPAQNGLVDNSNPQYSYILSAIALFVLIIACINFVNLTVARSVKRAKEIGIRKVIGGDRKQLVTQFLGESFILCFVAFVLAVGLVQLLLPVFNRLSNKALALSYLFDARLIIGYCSLFLITGLLAGFYPALVLSGYRPVDTLYSRFQLAGKNYLQRSLVVLQFALASFLIIATFTIYSQFNYLTTVDLGYDDSNLVMVRKSNFMRDELKLFRQQMMQNPNVISVSGKNGGSWGTGAKVNGDSMMQFTYETVDETFIPQMKIKILQGRNFSSQYSTDASSAVIVNEAFVKKAGWKNPLGQEVNFWYRNNERYRVIGVVKDYHFNSLNQVIGPQLFTMRQENMMGVAYVKIKPGSEAASLKSIEATFKKLFPLFPYSFAFSDQENLKAYEAEAKWKQIMFFSAVLTIFISCIGLFGLSVLSAEKRTKEIGVRKVLGASVGGVVTILSKDFLKLVIISLLIAIPTAWLAADKWLQNCPYRVSLQWWLFVAAGVLVILIAMVTVSFQAIKAAIANPVKSLRTE